MWEEILNGVEWRECWRLSVKILRLKIEKITFKSYLWANKIFWTSWHFQKEIDTNSKYIIKLTYERTDNTVRMHDEEFETFGTSWGLKQSCFLSSLLKKNKKTTTPLKLKVEEWKKQKYLNLYFQTVHI